jgi:capsular exopolysaccharide synthesis family protein
MLDIERLQPSVMPVTGVRQGGSEEPTSGMHTGLHAIRRHLRFVLVSASLFVLAGVLFAFLTGPLYTAEGTLLIDAHRTIQAETIGLNGGQSTVVTIDPATVESQLEILKSEQLARDVIVKLNLTTNPSYAGGGPLSHVVGALRRLIRGPSATDPQDVPASALRSFASQLDVRRVRETYLISVRFRVSDPELSATIVNTLLQGYLERDSERRQLTVERENSWLQERLAQLRLSITKADQELRRAAQTTDANVDLSRLQREADSYRTIYQSFLEHYAASTQRQSFPFAEAQVFSNARPPEDKSSPNLPLNLTLFLLGGLAFGCGGAVLLDMADRSFRTPLEVQFRLGVPIVGILPRLGTTPTGSASKVASLAKRLLPFHASAGRPISPRDVYRHTSIAPASLLADGIRSIRAAIDAQIDQLGRTAIGVTSVSPGEGKATVVANLGYLIARCGKSVLLVDADVRHARLTHVFRRDDGTGLAHLLAAEADLASAVREIEPNLFVVGTGVSQEQAKACLDLDLSALPRLLDLACTVYDYVIVVMPPLTPFAETRALVSGIGALLLVIEWRATSRFQAQDLIAAAPHVHQKLVGAALNRVDLRRPAIEIDGMFGTLGSFRLVSAFSRN